MGSNNSETYSLQSFSVRNETKAKFDALLKTAARKTPKAKSSISRENLLDDDEAEAEENAALAEDNYILNKFLGSGTGDGDVRPPVPKPRTKKRVEGRRDSMLSQGTFEVVSPKIVKSPASSNKTYNVEEVGDVLIHDNFELPRKVMVREKFVEKGEIETLSDDQGSKLSDDRGSKISCERVKEKIEDSVEYASEVKPKVAKRKKKKEESEEEILKKVYSYEKIVEVVVHSCDRLKFDSLVIHPVVKIHVVDAATGEYLNKSDKTRSVVFFYENKDFDYISPVMTHAYNLQEKRTLFPLWEEAILLNEDYDYFLEKSKQAVIFFEILDFVSFSDANNHGGYHFCCIADHSKGWHKIAFAFLKPVGKNNAVNLNKRLRLQLYHLGPEPKKYCPQAICPIWSHWKKKKLSKYPSTLYVTVKGVISPSVAVDVLRSKTPIQGERGSGKLAEEAKIETVKGLEKKFGELDERQGDERAKVWSRFPHETCKLPNKCVAKFDTYDEGCFVMKFSNNGLYLACAVRSEDLYCLMIISVLNLEEVRKFSCHQGLIYSIRWSSDDSLLITSSADNTVSVYNFKKSSFLQILPHPSFVYSSDINCDVIASACFDGIVRVWQKHNETPVFNLFQELEGHKGYVTSLCFIKTALFSADSSGAIMEWKREQDDWSLSRELKIFELRETVINEMKPILPKGKRLIVHSRDNTLRVVDTKSFCVLQTLQGASNKRIQTFFTISACGSYVLSGSENGTVHVWNPRTGENIATYSPYSSNNRRLPVHCVEFHPLDNLLAFSHYGENLPVMLYSHQRDVADEDGELKFNENTNGAEAKEVKQLKLKVIEKKHLIAKEKFDFKGILKKMDEIITT